MNIELPTPTTSEEKNKSNYYEQQQSPTLNLKSRSKPSAQENASVYTPDATMKLTSSQKSEEEDSCSILLGDNNNNYLDQEVLLTITKLQDLESKVSGIADAKDSLLNLKATILRTNLKNTLLKNELARMKLMHSHEREMLSEEIRNREQIILANEREKEAINARNLKLVKYIKTLKNERIKKYVNENRQLKARLDHLENFNDSNLESPSGLASPGSPTLGKLNTLGRIASVYLRESKPKN